jgi:hypothetical protein
VLDARAAGLHVSTLAARQCAAHEHLDIMIRNGITAVCDLGDGLRKIRNQPVELRRRRFGVWELSVSMSLPGCSAFPFRSAHRLLVHRALRRTALCGTSLHVVIDAARLATGRAQARDELEAFLRRASALRHQAKLRIETIAQIVQRRSRPCPVMPSQSILRRAG